MIILTLVLMLIVSDQYLTSIGVYYTLEGGSKLQKFHISTYLAMFMFLCHLFRFGNPIDAFFVLVRARPAYMTYLTVIVALSLYLMALQGTSGIAFIIDALARPAVIALLVLTLAPGQRRVAFLTVLGLIVLNSLIGISEVLLSDRLSPYTIQGLPVYEGHFRATALMGHPLNNAIITATALIFASTYLRSAMARAVVTIILILGLFSFGGRTALGVSMAFVILMLGYKIGQDLRHGRFNLAEGILLAAMLVLTPLLIGAVVQTTNVGSRILERMNWGSSAEVRVESLNIFQFMTTDDLLFGMSGRRLEELTRYLSNVETIENFWVVLIARMGAISFALFVLAFGYFCYRLMREGQFPAKAGVIMFLIIASGNNSLAAKNPALSVLVILIICGASYTARRIAPVPTPRSLPRGTPGRNTQRRRPPISARDPR